MALPPRDKGDTPPHLDKLKSRKGKKNAALKALAAHKAAPFAAA